MDDDARYEVLRNDEDQYSLWLTGQEVPAGWYRVGKEGTRDECSAYVDEVWTDMRPRSRRERMDGRRGRNRHHPGYRIRPEDRRAGPGSSWNSAVARRTILRPW